tara:strand:+ start:1147 stop:1761 length:615 start_codon:yes stop_codon:yes gene_type:complete
MSNTTKTFEQTFQDLALIHEDTLSSLQHLSVYALNYLYVDFESGKLIVSGTESDWLMRMVQQGLHQKLALRLCEFSHPWVEDSELYQAYQAMMQKNSPDKVWMKTEFCVPGKHGMHLLEMGHTKSLSIDTYNAFIDALNTFKYESMRLQVKYPSMVYQCETLPAILQQQEAFAEEDRKTMESMRLEFDLSLFEPIPEPTLKMKH